MVGSGAIGCWPTESISVKGLGSTKVYYRGDPVVKKGPGLKLFRIGGNKGSSSTYEDDEPVPDETPAQEEPAPDEDHEDEADDASSQESETVEETTPEEEEEAIEEY